MSDAVNARGNIPKDVYMNHCREVHEYSKDEK